MHIYIYIYIYIYVCIYTYSNIEGPIITIHDVGTRYLIRITVLFKVFFNIIVVQQ